MTLLGLVGCTSNPVGEDTISTGKRKISGQVQLDGNNHPERVYVWLEGFNLGAFTEEDGSFTLTLPTGINDAVNGIFKLYFYVANYKLDFVEVVVKEGEFVYGEAALNSKGELSQIKRMEQILVINTQVEPNSIMANFNGDISIELALRTVSENADTATVIFPNTTAGLLGPVFFQNIETKEIFIFESIPVKTRESEIVGKDPIKRFIKFPFNNINVPPAKYEVIPYILVNHEKIPEELLNSIGSNVEELSPNYLRIPFARDGGEFEVK